MYNHQLDTFICVADNGSFNKAAEKLFMSTTAVFKQINDLESRLSLSLLRRTNQGVSLTPAGSVIYDYAKQIMRLSRDAITEARKDSASELAVLRVGTSVLNPSKPFFDLWDKISDQFPEYQLHVISFQDNHEYVLSEIDALGDKYDFIIAGCDSRQWLSRCNFLKLGYYPHAIAVSRKHPLAKKEKVSVSDLCGYTIMMVKEGYSDIVDQIRGVLKTFPQIRIEDTPPFYDVEVFNLCAKTGNILLTISPWNSIHPALVTIPVDWDYHLPYGILYQKNPPGIILRVIEAIRNSTF